MPKGKKLNIKPCDRFGRMVILKEVYGKAMHRRYFSCKCDCGKIKTVRLDGLTSGSVVSCGCFNIEKSIEANTKHGLSDSRIYKIFSGMKGRCLNPNNDFYKNYGGRGITICDEWLNFEIFYKWAINNGYRENLTIERVDVNKGYCPENCTWITMDEQKRNTTVSKKITFNGKTQTLRQWSAEIGIHSSTLCHRFKCGMSVESALTHKKYASI